MFSSIPGMEEMSSEPDGFSLFQAGANSENVQYCTDLGPVHGTGHDHLLQQDKDLTGNKAATV